MQCIHGLVTTVLPKLKLLTHSVHIGNLYHALHYRLSIKYLSVLTEGLLIPDTLSTLHELYILFFIPSSQVLTLSMVHPPP